MSVKIPYRAARALSLPYDLLRSATIAATALVLLARVYITRLQDRDRI